MSSYLFPLNVPRGENPLSKLTRWTTSLDLDYLGIVQPNLNQVPVSFWSRSNRHVPHGDYCPPECAPKSQPHLSTCMYMELPRGEGRTTHTPCIGFSIGSFTLAYHNGLDAPRGENSSPLKYYEWYIGDRGD